MLPTIRLHDKINTNAVEIHTTDFYFQNVNNIQTSGASCDYYSQGILDNFERLAKQQNISLEAFMVMEPPVVAPHLYRALPKLTKFFKRVYVHNVHGDGYSLKGVDKDRLHKFYYPIPYRDVLENFWTNAARMNRVVVINSNHNPILYGLRHFIFKMPQSELYSKRMEAVAGLAKLDAVELYGPRWEKWWSPVSMWRPYWKHRGSLMSVYKGVCRSKHEVLSHYKFCLCFENMYMDGYVTEKIFDCLYAGTIPLYLGAKNIADLIPPEVYIDCRKYSSRVEMWEDLKKIPDSQAQTMREAGRCFLRSEAGLRYYNSLENVFACEPKNSTST